MLQQLQNAHRPRPTLKTDAHALPLPALILLGLFLPCGGTEQRLARGQGSLKVF